MRRTQWSWFLISLALLSLPLLLSAPEARAASVVVSPADTTVLLGDTFTLRVEADAFSDLKAYELIFRYGEAVLQYVGPTAGDVLTAGGGAYTVQPLSPVSPPPFTAGVDCARLDGSTSGPGVLIYYTFKGEFTVPANYYFAASKGVGLKLQSLLANPTRLREELIKNWDAQCKTGITETEAIPLEGDLLAYLKKFDFSIFKYKTVVQLVIGHASTIFHTRRFGTAISW